MLLRCQRCFFSWKAGKTSLNNISFIDYFSFWFYYSDMLFISLTREGTSNRLRSPSDCYGVWFITCVSNTDSSGFRNFQVISIVRMSIAAASHLSKPSLHELIQKMLPCVSRYLHWKIGTRFELFVHIRNFYVSIFPSFFLVKVEKFMIQNDLECHF